MSAHKIGWCTKTINPIIGCRKISPGCDNCYAERMAARLASGLATGGTRFDYQEVITLGKWNGNQVFRAKELKKTDKWQKSQRIFVGSMGDTFKSDNAFTGLLFEYVKKRDNHSWLFLTKRPKNYMAIQLWFKKCAIRMPYHIWWGITAENQECFDKRMAELDGFTGQVFVSFEPLLGPVNISKYADRIKWAIIGGETGPGAREVIPNWVFGLVYQCEMKKIPVYFKQWGKHNASPFMKSYCNLKQFPEGMKGI